jgi:RNA polymerase sigma factor (sigma-70 family)
MKVDETKEAHRLYWTDLGSDLRPKLDIYGRGLGIPADEIGDVTQETILRTILYAKDPAALEKGPVEYACGTLRRVWFDKLKSDNKKHMDTVDNPETYKAVERRLPLVESQAFNRCQLKEWRAMVEQELETLDELDRKLFKLHLLEKGNEEIANILQLPKSEVSTAWNLLKTKLAQRVRRRLLTGQTVKAVPRKRVSRKKKTKTLLTPLGKKCNQDS